MLPGDKFCKMWKAVIATIVVMLNVSAAHGQNLFVNVHNVQVVNGSSPSITFDVYLSTSATYQSNVASDVNLGLQNVDVALEVDFGTDGSVAAGTTSPILASSYASSGLTSFVNSINGANLSGAMQTDYDSRFKFNLDRVLANTQLNQGSTKVGTFTVNYPNGTVIGTNAGGAKISIRTNTGGTGSKWSDFLANTGQTIGTSNTFSNATALPLQLLSFAAWKDEDDSYTAHVKWITASERDMDYYELERSADGREFDHVVVRMNATGNDKTYEQHYVSEDQDALEGNNYYRLKMVGHNGKTSYSRVITVNFKYLNSIASLFPNPVASNGDEPLTLRLRTQYTGSTSYHILGVNGTVLHSGTVVLRNGEAKYEIKGILGLAAGAYFLAIDGIGLPAIRFLIK